MNTSLTKSRFVLSRISIGIIVLLSYLQTSSLHTWKWGNGVIYWDTISYYAYLPALFIHHDLSLEFTKEDPVKNSNRYWPETTDEGKLVIKTTAGLSFLYFPFFITAHLLAGPLGFEADGFSEIYQVCLAFSPLPFLLIGLIFVKRILRKYFTDGVIALTILSLGLATNLYFYSSTTTMSHTFSFALISIFLYVGIKWIERPGYRNSVILGILLGLISLIRPTNAIIFLFPVLFRIRDFKGLWQRILYFVKKPQFVLIIFACIFIIWLPQFLYWKMQTGHYLYFSYSEGERFFWTQPEIFKGLFGFRKGWLIYSPVMVFSLVGIVLSYRKLKDWFLPLVVIIPLSIYIMLSWWTWWYGGGFGMRPIIDYYGLLSVPLALSLETVAHTLARHARYLAYLLFLCFFSLGVFHHFQAVDGAIHWDSMTWKSYKYNFGHTKMTEEAEKFLAHPDYERAKVERE